MRFIYDYRKKNHIQQLQKTSYLCNRKKKRMKNKDTNLTQFFVEYLTYHHSSKVKFNVDNITMACYGALNEQEESYKMEEVIFDMRTDFEFIYKVLDNIARSITKNKSYEKENQSKSEENNEYYTIPEIANKYPISAQALRKACTENRLQHEEGRGKNKYLIKKSDIDCYMAHAKGKQNNNTDSIKRHSP